MFMAILRWAKNAQQLEECWRIKLDEIRQRYERDKNPERKTEYLQALKQFTDLVLKGKV